MCLAKKKQHFSIENRRDWVTTPATAFFREYATGKIELDTTGFSERAWETETPERIKVYRRFVCFI